jgi:exopolysaccharide biosynthesis polyprenyl glycosylphosphotransferase
MSNLRRKLLSKGTRVLDIIVMVTAFLVNLYFHSPEESPHDFIGFLSLKIKILNVFALFILVIGWNRLFAFFGLYEIRRLGNRLREWLDIIKAVTVSVLFLAAISFLISRRNIDQEVLFSFWASCIVLSIASRTAVRQYLIYLRNHGRNLRHVVFVGSGKRAVDLAQKVISKPELGYKLLGFIDDDMDFQNGKYIPRVKRLCTIDELPAFIENHVVDEVFIALPIKSFYDKIRNVAALCNELGIVCRVPSDWFEFKTARTAAFELDGVPILTMYTGSEHQMHHLELKRFLDATVSAMLMVFFSPVFTAIALMIKINSKGPVFFRQERIGYNRRLFKILKFRTMIEGAEALQTDLEHLNEADGPAFKIYNDPRITSVGKWLRRTSLDELPQLINVLMGDMSLVGPRPLPKRDVQGMDEPWQKRRFSMRPGLTCLWQVNGRNKLSFNDWMRLDLEYIDRWSIWLDMKILARTVPAIIKATGQ